MHEKGVEEGPQVDLPSGDRGTLALPDKWRASIKKTMHDKGFLSIGPRDGKGYGVMLRDPVTGTYFESLTNRDVVFYPSGSHV